MNRRKVRLRLVAGFLRWLQQLDLTMYSNLSVVAQVRLSELMDHAGLESPSPLKLWSAPWVC